jgi:hypothetical protein
MSADFDIDEELDRLGYGNRAARKAAREALEAAGLTRPGKRRMAVAKRQMLRQTLAESLWRLCPECVPLEARRAAGRRVVAVEARACEHCGGSDNRRYALRALDALAEAGMRRIVVVGGSPGTRQELRDLFANRVDVRFVDGSSAHRQSNADALIAWADLIVVWGSTELPHKVSDLYTQAPEARSRLVMVHRRGVAALCQAILTHLGFRATAGACVA